jgi:hypothetical protein
MRQGRGGELAVGGVRARGGSNHARSRRGRGVPEGPNPNHLACAFFLRAGLANSLAHNDYPDNSSIDAGGNGMSERPSISERRTRVVLRWFLEPVSAVSREA